MNDFRHNHNLNYSDLHHTVLERLMHYYLYLYKSTELESDEKVNSFEIARHFNLNDTLVRKDLAKIGVKGVPRVGYDRRTVVGALIECLGLNYNYNAVLVGAGRLGGAIAEYKPFFELGLTLVGIFDVDTSKIGKKAANQVIQPISELRNKVRNSDVKLGILTCDKEAAQKIAEDLIEAGVRALWNFSPQVLEVPSDIFVRNEHISVGLAELTYHLKNIHSTLRG